MWSVSIFVVVVWSQSLVQLFMTPWTTAPHGFLVPHYLLEFAQVHVCWIGDAIQPSHHLSSSSAFNVSQHQGLFQWVSCLHQVALSRSFLVAHMVKNPPAVWETWVQPLGWENPLQEGMATHSSILAWRIPMDRGAWQAIVHGVAKTQSWLSD